MKPYNGVSMAILERPQAEAWPSAILPGRTLPPEAGRSSIGDQQPKLHFHLVAPDTGRASLIEESLLILGDEVLAQVAVDRSDAKNTVWHIRLDACCIVHAKWHHEELR